MFTRVKQIRISLQLSQRQFGEHLGLRQSTINDIEHNRCNINDRLIIAICSRFNVNENWLRTGNGEMFNIIDKKFDEFFTIYNNLAEPLQQYLLTSAKELLKTQAQLNL